MTASTVSVKLPRDLYLRLQELANRQQTDIVELLHRLTSAADASSEFEGATTEAFRAIIARAADLEVSDLAEQHDHYLYGTEKQ
jgi:predicted transcriptional regulator